MPTHWWMKLANETYGNPKLAQALSESPHADRIWIVLLGINSAHDCDGRISPELTTDAGIAARLPRLVPEAEVPESLRALENSGLIAREADRTIILRGWDDSWRTPKTSTERSAKRRATKRDGP